MLIWLHTKHEGDDHWTHAAITVARLPAVDEMVAVNKAECYKVVNVVHMLFPAGWEAEVFAIQEADGFKLPEVDARTWGEVTDAAHAQSAENGQGKQLRFDVSP